MNRIRKSPREFPASLTKTPLSVLCVVDRRNNQLTQALRDAGHTVVETYTGDHAVAVSVGTHFDAVILDQELFIETEGWSLAQSFKMVRPKVCVLLVVRAQQIHGHVPAGVDAMVPDNDMEATLRQLVTMTRGESKAS